MTAPSTKEKNAAPFWEYVRVKDYQLPAAPVNQVARKRFSSLRVLFRRETAEQEAPLHTGEDLKTLPLQQLDRIAPLPAWNDAAASLGLDLQGWLDQENPGPPVIVLLGPPYHGHADILTSWAEQREWEILGAPSPEQILSGDDRWLSGLHKQKDVPWVFPALERAYFRNSMGLNLVRCFLDNAFSGQFGRGIIGCDSWAWAFLQYAWRGRQPIVLTLQSFDQARLAAHFQHLAAAACIRPLRFRLSHTGSYVLPPPEEADESNGISDFVQLLAAHSRGIAGVAWALWRSSLHTEPDEALKIATDQEAQEGSGHDTVWVTPWEQVQHPSLPDGAGRDEAFVLHALLLHNGLEPQLLQQILSMSANQVMETLFRLEAANLVVRNDAIWQVTPLGYPAVRTFLQKNGYLIDQF